MIGLRGRQWAWSNGHRKRKGQWTHMMIWTMNTHDDMKQIAEGVGSCGPLCVVRGITKMIKDQQKVRRFCGSHIAIFFELFWQHFYILQELFCLIISRNVQCCNEFIDYFVSIVYKHPLYQSCTAGQDLKFCSWNFAIWDYLEVKIFNTWLQNFKINNI
jgi:hypothetical protein